MKKTIYVLGNPLVDADSLPLKLLPELQKHFSTFSFELFDPTEEVNFNEYRELIMIDSAIGISKVTVFHDLSYFDYSPRVTVHDYDLPLYLGLLQKLKKIKNMTVIGVPVKGNRKAILAKVINYIHLTFRK